MPQSMQECDVNAEQAATSARLRNQCRKASRMRGRSSKQGSKAVPMAKESLPITARVKYSDRVDTMHYDVLGDGRDDGDKGREAPTPVRFTHFGGSSKRLSPSTSISDQETGLSDAVTPARWSRMGSVAFFPAAQAA